MCKEKPDFKIKKIKRFHLASSPFFFSVKYNDSFYRIIAIFVVILTL